MGFMLARSIRIEAASCSSVGKSNSQMAPLKRLIVPSHWSHNFSLNTNNNSSRLIKYMVHLDTTLPWLMGLVGWNWEIMSNITSWASQIKWAMSKQSKNLTHFITHSITPSHFNVTSQGFLCNRLIQVSDKFWKCSKVLQSHNQAPRISQFLQSNQLSSALQVNLFESDKMSILHTDILPWNWQVERERKATKITKINIKLWIMFYSMPAQA